jgi:dihydroorotate dehydrogenase (fumarate)
MGMADLTTSWLGLNLESPFVVAASPLSHDPEAVAAAAAAGAGAVVLYSLFEEDLTQELSAPRPSLAGMDPYLRQIEVLRKQVAVPVVASLNGTTPGGWTKYARSLEAAGAAALELNLYEVASSPTECGAELEFRQVDVVAAVVSAVKLPVTVKLSPFYSSVPAFVRRLEEVGARGVTVFNRFYQPDISLDTLQVDRRVVASTSAELPLRLHALALLSPFATLSLGCSGGVHSGLDAAKAILCGAHVVQLASALLERGPGRIGGMREELSGWLDSKKFASIAAVRGKLGFGFTADPHAWERLNYTRTLHGGLAAGGGGKPIG